MDLPVMPPVKPMLAKLSHDLPAAGDILFEPKWDGFVYATACDAWVSWT